MIPEPIHWANTTASMARTVLRSLAANRLSLAGALILAALLVLSLAAPTLTR